MSNKKAIRITGQTLVGYLHQGEDYPYKGGNCFSVRTEDLEEYRIVNFCIENLEEVVRRGIKFPINISVLEEGVAIINDERIPYNWYDVNYCEVCCPKHLLPPQQQLEIERQIKRGERVEQDELVTFNPDKAPDLRTEGEKKNYDIFIKEELDSAVLDTSIFKIGSINKGDVNSLGDPEAPLDLVIEGSDKDKI